MKYNYDTIAAVYDRLARLVFGNTLSAAQLWLLAHIPPYARVLIAGGGTGWVLEEITRLHPAGLDILYIDASEKMTALARRRFIGQNKVTFMSMPVEHAAIPQQYDIVLTPFLFDNLTGPAVDAVFLKLHHTLAPGGLWLYADFSNHTGRAHQLLLKAMYLFFGLLCGVKARQLPAMDSIFSHYGYRRTAHQQFMKGFVVAEVNKVFG